jgi:predicted ATPase/class 3 adenylate cyclase
MLLQKPQLDWHPVAGPHDSPESRTFPTGTVTFLLSDIEGSTALLEYVGDEVFERLLQEHHRIVREAIAAHGGVEVSADDAGFFVVFSDAGEALATATDTQTALCGLGDSDNVQVRVRMGLHTGPGRRVEGTYSGLAVRQASLVCQAGHGGQIVATEATRVAAGGLADGNRWQPLGKHRLQGLSLPLELHQLCHPGSDETFETLHSLGAFTHHLPVQASSFLGRVEELVLGAKLLAANRLLSVVGPGGSGKTRVAYQLAEAHLHQFPDGVWAVELAAEVDPQRIPAMLLSRLGLRDEPGRSATESIVSHLQASRALIVLDNCEHLIDAAASFASELLHACEKLRVLVTSREALRIEGETVWRLGPLQLPEIAESNFSEIAGSDAVALFCERAGESLAGFSLDTSNVATVTTICRRVEGMPLTIELAAAWVRSLPLAQIAERLENSLDLLSKGSRRGAERHSSLRATLAWSHDLLDPTEQVLFRRLAVFSGGFTLGAAERLGPGEGLDVTEVLDALDGLVDKSLVVLSIDQAGQGRYRLLETVRAYAHERLEAAGELARQIDRHAEFYSGLAAECDADVASGANYDRMEADHPNLLAALEYLRGSDQPNEYGQLVVHLAPFWNVRGYWQLGDAELRRCIAQGESDSAFHAACHRHLAIFASRIGDYGEARSAYEEALVTARQLGDRREEATDLSGLGQVAWYVADYAESRARYEDAMAIALDLGDRQMEAKCLLNLGMVAHWMSNYTEARSHYARALEIAREVGDRQQEAHGLGALGITSSAMGDDDDALARYEEALAIFHEIGSPGQEAGFIGNIGRVHLRRGNYAESQSRIEEALAITRAIGDRQSEGYWIGCLGQLASQVDDYDDARDRFAEALAIARELGDRRSQRDWLGELGGTECTVGRHAEARAHYREALVIAREVGRPDDRLLESCAELFVALECFEHATELLGAADAITTQTGGHRTVSEQSRYDITLMACRAHQREPGFELAYKRGNASDWAYASVRASELLEQI